MPTPTISHRTQESLAFAVRIRVQMPQNSPKRFTSDILTWLFTRHGRDGFAHRRMGVRAGSPEVFYFRQLDDAQEFLAAFPELKPANGTASEADAAPMPLEG
jgi:hypothetical protein